MAITSKYKKTLRAHPHDLVLVEIIFLTHKRCPSKSHSRQLFGCDADKLNL